MCPSAAKTKDNYEQLRGSVIGQLNELTSQRKYDRVNLVAISLGNAAFAAVSGEFEKFDSVHLVVNGTTMASAMWHGILTPKIRAGIEAEGHTLSSLEDEWRMMSPIDQLPALEGKDMSIMFSSADEIIPSRYQYEYIEAARDNGLRPRVMQSRLGHCATIGRFCLSGEV